MKTSYRGYEIYAKRERALGGWDNLYFYVMRESDQKFMVDDFTTGGDTVRDYIRYMKERIDAEHVEKDPWGEAAEDLCMFWSMACGADPFEGSDTFHDRMEAVGYIELVPVTHEALAEMFAYERGIEHEGMMWQLTEAGQSAFEKGFPG